MGVAFSSGVRHGAAGGATLLDDVDQEGVEDCQQHKRQQDEYDSREPVEYLWDEEGDIRYCESKQ